MDETWQGYSAAQALRTGTPQVAREALLAARARTLVLADAYADALGPHGMRVPYRATLNPPLWEIGHVAWFQEWWIGRNTLRSLGIACDPDGPRSASWLPNADALYDSSRVGHATRWDLPLPDARTTREYLAATLGQTLATLDKLGPAASDDELYFFRLVALHEAMHAEAAVYMTHSLGVPLPHDASYPVEPLGRRDPIHIPAQRFKLGWSGAGFAFDNEFRPMDVDLEAFEIDAQPVSWDRFLAFARADGYRRRDLWDAAGWAWLQEQGIPDHEAHAADPHGAATHLTAYEADAWCRWARRKLPTEAQWECAALADPRFSWGQAWEWTASPFEPYPGFVPHPYRDYSAPWFGTRRVLRGACPATSPMLAHPRYRNFFEPQRNDILAGFRSCA
jgi:gamma-glutamyl hercynylcysteine S-oxide synthase